jgi:catechol 2,3-dioxygenase-like lactoylglutathione lyase family enzyme
MHPNHPAKEERRSSACLPQELPYARCQALTRGTLPPNAGTGAFATRIGHAFVMTLGPLDFVTVQVRDWPLMVAWYRDVLGFETMSWEEDDGFCLFTTGEGGTMLALASDHPEQSTATGENRLAPGFRVSDLDETLRRLRSTGVRIDADIDGGDEGYRLARSLERP